jgi:hypothetical protein
VTYFESHVSEVAFPGQPVWKIWTFLGNRFHEAHIRSKAQAKETELVTNRYFLCGPPVSAYVPEFKRAAIGDTMRVNLFEEYKIDRPPL